MINLKKTLTVFLQTLLFVMIAGHSWAAGDSLDAQVKNLQAEVSALERDIDVLEKNLLFPPLTRVEVYLSLDGRSDFMLKSVTLKLDDTEKSFHIYTKQDIAALHMGGKQQLWEGNVALGQHRLTATFKGTNKKGESIEKTAALGFEKKLAGRSMELVISATNDSNQPVFSVKDWGEK